MLVTSYDPKGFFEILCMLTLIRNFIKWVEAAWSVSLEQLPRVGDVALDNLADQAPACRTLERRQRDGREAWEAGL